MSGGVRHQLGLKFGFIDTLSFGFSRDPLKKPIRALCQPLQRWPPLAPSAIFSAREPQKSEEAAIKEFPMSLSALIPPPWSGFLL